MHKVLDSSNVKSGKLRNLSLTHMASLQTRCGASGQRLQAPAIQLRLKCFQLNWLNGTSGRSPKESLTDDHYSTVQMHQLMAAMKACKL